MFRAVHGRSLARYVAARRLRASGVWRRNLLTLAIETSCDDTSVAILERCERASTYRLHFHQKITADNSAFGGIHPARAISSHQQNLSGLVNRSLWSLPDPEPSPTCDDGTCIGVSTCDGGQLEKRKPHFISVTRGPGITAALACGLDTAKALSVAWQVPLVGVNHMQAHALTPRLDNALDSRGYAQNAPSFPYLSLLVSGGHTLLVSSKSLCEHSILASTTDIAVGDALDKMARSILPEEDLDGSEIMYGRLLERYAFAQGEDHREYAPPRTRAEEIASKPTKWGWALPIPLAATKDMSFSFAGLGSSVKRICDSRGKGMDRAERTDLARESMRVAFEHLATRVVRAMKELQHKTQTTTNLVLSGGVASNRYLRFIMRSLLDAHGLTEAQVISPSIELCTDNAAMVAWTGMEMYDQGWSTELSSRALRKWSIDPGADDGGILGATGWMKR